jgi:hypothetical protein
MTMPCKTSATVGRDSLPDAPAVVTAGFGADPAGANNPARAVDGESVRPAAGASEFGDGPDAVGLGAGAGVDGGVAVDEGRAGAGATEPMIGTSGAAGGPARVSSASGVGSRVKRRYRRYA